MSRAIIAASILAGFTLFAGCARQDAVDSLKQELQKTQEDLKTLRTQVEDVDARLAQENHAMQILAQDMEGSKGDRAREIEKATAEIQAQAKTLSLKIPEAIQPLSNQILQQASDIRALSARVDTLNRDIASMERSRATPTPAPVSVPTPPPTPQVTAEPALFNGAWTAAFTFERNTRNTAEVRHPWIVFRMRLQQTGQTVTGTLEGTDNNVTGTVSGKATGGVLQGTIRLSWDSQDWETFNLNLDTSGSSGNGTAVFRANEREQHFYSVVLSR